MPASLVIKAHNVDAVLLRSSTSQCQLQLRVTSTELVGRPELEELEGIEGASCFHLTDDLSASQVCLSGGREGEEATEGNCQTGQVFSQE